MNRNQVIRTTLLIGAALAVLTACQKEEGPVEQMGKNVDEAVEQAADTMKEAADDIEDAAKR